MRYAVAAFLLAATMAAVSAAAAADRLDLALGRALFERDWVSAPASTGSADGLGPLFNARNCAGCHRGPARAARFTTVDGKLASQGLVVRLSDAEGRPDPVYGLQLQNQAVAGLEAEGRVSVLAPAEGVPADGAPAQALDVAVAFSRGPARPGTRLSFRQAPALLGRGDLGRIPEAAILARADPDDADGDGISGRANRVATPAGPRLGRFGWKARHADLDRQIAEAFMVDLGLSSPGAPHPHGDCTSKQVDCLAAPSGAEPRAAGQELSQDMIARVRDFVGSLPSPAPARDDPGEARFAAAGCTACHVPRQPAAGGGTVRAFTDLLLHDMGPGLDDGAGESGVASGEWRTAPLSGMSSEGGRRRYLHDARAGTVDAAIRAHGGEAAAARRRYERLDAVDRDALLAFIEAL